jgi:hypothetical protein
LPQAIALGGATQAASPALRPGFWVAALLLLLLTAAPVQALPLEFSASYFAKARGFTLGLGHLELARDGEGGYRYSSDIRATGPLRLLFSGRIREHSSGRLEDGVLVPDAYEYQRTGPGAREDSVRFSDNGTSVLRYKGRTTEHRLPADAVDPLSLHLALMRDLSRGEEHLRYLVVEPRRLKAYQMEVRGRERIHTQYGWFDALRVDVVGSLTVTDPTNFDLASADIPPIDDGDSTTFWFSPELEYLLVRVRHTDADEGTAELELQELGSLTLGAPA